MRSGVNGICTDRACSPCPARHSASTTALTTQGVAPIGRKGQRRPARLPQLKPQQPHGFAQRPGKAKANQCGSDLVGMLLNL